MFIHQVNVGGVTKGNKVALKFMQKRGGGTIINTASMAGIGAMRYVYIHRMLHHHHHQPTNSEQLKVVLITTWLPSTLWWDGHDHSPI